MHLSPLPGTRRDTFTWAETARILAIAPHPAPLSALNWGLVRGRPQEIPPVPSCWPCSPTDESAGIFGHLRLTTAVPGAVRRQECAECSSLRSRLRPPPAPRGAASTERFGRRMTVFVKDLGQQVHTKVRTKSDSFPVLPVQFRVPPTHVRVPGPDARRPRLR